MYRDVRPADTDPRTASTPESWARTFAAATRMNRWRMLRFTRTREWALIRRHVPRGARVLEAGCGFGEWVTFLSRKGYRAEGLDYSAALVDRLRDTYPDLRWTQGDVRALPYEDKSFDAVVSWGVIEHDEAGPAGALEEFHRVLEPGGVAIVTVPVDSAAQRRSAEYLYYGGERPQTFFQYFMTKEELHEQVRAAGFQVVEEAVLPNAVLQLVSPPLAARLNGLAFRAANFAVSTLMSSMPQYCVMRYAVAVKR